MSYPHQPGAKNTDTSRAAARLIEGSAAVLRERALEAILARPQTSWELSKTLGVPFESIQPRTSELRKKGLIIDTGKRGPARSIRLTAIVWGTPQ